MGIIMSLAKTQSSQRSYMSKNEVTLKGKSTLRAFERGAIRYWMDKGMELSEAINEAVKRGLCVHEQTVDNLVVTAGKQLLADLLIDVETTGIAYHEFGTGATAPGLADTALTTASVRKAVTSKSRSGNQVLVSTFYLASESAYAIKEAGIFGGSLASSTPGSGKMLCHYLQTYDNSAGMYDLTFEYALTIN